MNKRFDPITLQILWNRLIAIADEAATNLLRTSFSTVVRESQDFVCVLLDAQGNSLAQASFGPPSFLSTLPRTVKQILRVFPVEAWRPGDVVITNDPWIGTGHLPDINVAIPVFSDGRLVAFAASVAHAPDIGGRVRAAEARDLFEEGLRIPVCKVIKEGQPNEEILNLIQNNVRVPDQVIGDLRAQISANEMASRRLIDLMNEYELRNLSSIAHTVQALSESAMRKAIAELPDGDYYHEVMSDGFTEPITIKIKLSIIGDRINVDYTGTSPQVNASLNVVPNYAYSYTFYPLKCALSPDVPNNEGCFRTVDVSAPEGSLLNPRFPAAVSTRGIIGHFLPMAVLGALAKIIPEKVMATSGNPAWAAQFFGIDRNNRSFSMLFFTSGGQGASANGDGLTCSSFPGNVSNTPVEIIESAAPFLFIETKEVRNDSGGPGKNRGGCGQTLSIRIRSQPTLTVALFGDRTKYPAPGLLGGRTGAVGQALLNDHEIRPKGQHVLCAGDRLVLSTPGGGGYGSPQERSLSAVLEDVTDEWVSRERARVEYGFENFQLRKSHN